MRHLTVAHGVFKYAMRKHGLTRNPASADLVDRPTVRYSGEFTTLDPEQLGALLRAAATRAGRSAVPDGLSDRDSGRARSGRCAGGTSISPRIGSTFAGLRRLAQTPGSRRRSPGKVRSVPMVSQVATALAGLCQREHFTDDDDLVFPNEVGEVAERRRCCGGATSGRARSCRLPPVRFHDLRHMFGSAAVKEFPLSDVQAMLGHAHITTTMRYVHHRPGTDDAQRLAKAFESDSVSPFVSRNGDMYPNSEQLSSTESP